MIRFDVKYNIDPNALRQQCTKAEKILTTQVMKDTRPYVPALTMSLNQRTHLEENEIVYPGPYARYLYYGKAMVDSKTGRGPFYIPNVGWRFHRGAKLRPTDKNLVFTKEVHPQATSHWFEVSKSVNLKKWEMIAAKAVSMYGNK